MPTVVHRTACPLDCPDGCTLDVTVDDGRLVAVDAAPPGEGNPLTQGWICQKVKHHHRRVYAPERVLTPLVRRGPKGSGDFRPATWDEALDLIAGRIDEALVQVGPDGVVPYLYSSSASVLAAGALTPLLFARIGAPDVIHTICAHTAGVAKDQIFGGMLSADPLDLPHAKLVVIWGANPTASNTHLLPLVTAAKRNGATIVVVDPRRTGAAKRADLHLAVMPGTDVVLAYALAGLLEATGRIDRAFCAEHATGVDEFLTAARVWTVDRAAEVCGVDAGDIRRLGELIATADTAMLRMGWGLERNRNGGSCWLAPPALWVLAGHFGRLGSGVVYSTGGASPIDLDRLWTSDDPRPPRTELSMNEVGPAILGELAGWSAPARVLFVQGANPANTAVDQATMLRALARDDVFTVVHDQVMTDTARVGRCRAPGHHAFRGRRHRRLVRLVHAPAHPGGDRPGRREPHQRRGGRRAGRPAGVLRRPLLDVGDGTARAGHDRRRRRRPAPSAGRGRHRAVPRHLPRSPRRAGPAVRPGQRAPAPRLPPVGVGLSAHPDQPGQQPDGDLDVRRVQRPGGRRVDPSDGRARRAASARATPSRCSTTPDGSHSPPVSTPRCGPASA